MLNPQTKSQVDSFEPLLVSIDYHSVHWENTSIQALADWLTDRRIQSSIVLQVGLKNHFFQVE